MDAMDRLGALRRPPEFTPPCMLNKGGLQTTASINVQSGPRQNLR
jgi:hypothetical protein